MSKTLSPCSGKPNCVCSCSPVDSAFYVPPFFFKSSQDLNTAWQRLEHSGGDLGFKTQDRQDNWLHGTATTRFLKFVDDVHFIKNSQKLTIEVRSESRLGYSDLGANRKRVESIRALLGALSQPAL